MAYVWELIKFFILVVRILRPVFPLVEVDTEPTQLWERVGRQFDIYSLENR